MNDNSSASQKSLRHSVILKTKTYLTIEKNISNPYKYLQKQIEQWFRI